MKKHIAYIAAGSNMGDRQGFIRASLALLERSSVQIKAVSSMVETEPWGFYAPTWFLNCAFCVSTDLSPYELLDILLDTERRLGRKRDKCGYSSRPIDLDLIFYDDRIITGETLVLPHPRMAERLFVLKPLNEIAPELIHPVLKKPINGLLADLKAGYQGPV